MLVHVCDVFDALRTNRPYRVAWESEEIIKYMERRIGQEFQADVARAFIRMIRERGIAQARAEVIDGEAVPALA